MITEIKIGKEIYYKADEIKKKYPEYFMNCKYKCDIIKILPNDSYIYGREKDNKWEKTDGKSKKYDKLLIKKEWINKNINEINIPKIIELSEEEKFRNSKGKIIEIEIRGKRENDKCYFSVNDIENKLKIKRLKKTLINKKGSFEYGRHYVKLNIPKYRNTINTTNELYLTYEGLLKVLFITRKHNLTNFIKWATKIVYTAHLGTKKQKRKLVSSLTGASEEAIKSVFSRTCNTLPAIYLMYLGTVEEIDSKVNIQGKYKKNEKVYKYGYTIDLNKRIQEHKRTYRKLGIKKIELTMFTYIDPQYVSEAENEIKHYFQIMGTRINVSKNDNNYKELVIISEEKMKYVRKEYEKIGKLYSGHVKEIIDKMRKMEQEIELMKVKHEKEIMKEKHEKEIMKEKYEKELMREKYEKEILKMEIEMLKKNNESKNNVKRKIRKEE
jgi:hypothetical protein